MKYMTRVRTRTLRLASFCPMGGMPRSSSHSLRPCTRVSYASGSVSSRSCRTNEKGHEKCKANSRSTRHTCAGHDGTLSVLSPSQCSCALQSWVWPAAPHLHPPLQSSQPSTGNGTWTRLASLALLELCSTTAFCRRIHTPPCRQGRGA